MALGKTFKPFILQGKKTCRTLLVLCSRVCQIDQEIHIPAIIVYDGNLYLTILVKMLSRTLIALPTDIMSCSWTPLWPSKIHHGFSLLYTCAVYKHAIIHSVWLTSKLGPEAISSVRKCIFTTHIHKINAKLCKETNKTS